MTARRGRRTKEKDQRRALVKAVRAMSDDELLAFLANARDEVKHGPRHHGEHVVDPRAPFPNNLTDAELMAELAAARAAAAEERAKAAPPVPEREPRLIEPPLIEHPVKLKTLPPWVDVLPEVPLTPEQERTAAHQKWEDAQCRKAKAAADQLKARLEAQAQRDDEQAMRSPSTYQGPLYGADWERPGTHSGPPTRLRGTT